MQNFSKYLIETDNINESTEDLAFGVALGVLAASNNQRSGAPQRVTGSLYSYGVPKIGKIRMSATIGVDININSGKIETEAPVSLEAAMGVNFIYQNASQADKKFKNIWKDLGNKEKLNAKDFGYKTKESMQKEINEFVRKQMEEHTSRIHKGIEDIVKSYEKDLEKTVSWWTEYEAPVKTHWWSKLIK